MTKRSRSKGTQGGKANASGEITQAQLVSTVQRYGFFPAACAGERGAALDGLRAAAAMSGRVFAEAVLLCSDIIGGRGVCDILMFDPDWPTPLAVLARNQSISGSINQKMEHKMHTVMECYPCPCFIVLNGDKMRPVLKRAYRNADESHGQIAGVYPHLDAFEREWLALGAEYPVPELKLPL